jgi:glutamine---fructose-6-phosphate transaminase (isomerizing)
LPRLQKKEINDRDSLNKLLAQYRRNENKTDCLIPFSGGRDSSYVLHYVKKELGLNPIAYSYDWGMITDLARRNISRMCGTLGIEHILISANINQKRANIRKNVLAWLRRPNLGMVPLFMAGDKQFFYYANLLMKQNNISISILGENLLETTKFKSGFCGIKPSHGDKHTYSLTAKNKIKLLAFYAKEYLLNPYYLNASLLDTLDAFRSYYVIRHKNINLYDYIEWNESKIKSLLIKDYGWETDPGTKATWRIGDGTAAFYNYIYYTVAGFTENDTFRSNQIRNGYITREEALGLIKEENLPRWDSLKWYCDTIGIDFEITIKRINSIPKLYRSS